MKVKVLVALVVVVGIGIAATNVFNLKQSKNKEVNLRLANILALTYGDETGGGIGGESAGGGEWGCGGNPTYIPDETLRSHACTIGGITGTHLVCDDEKKVCCDPSKQTDCKGIQK